MKTFRLTLQNRITTLLILSSIILISAFIFIQINTQILNIQRYNSYQANLSSIIAKNNLEAAARQAPPDDAGNYLKIALKELTDAKVVSEAIIYDREGKIVASTDNKLIGKQARFKETSKAQELDNFEKANKWFYPEIDRLKNRLDMYLSLRAQPDKTAYVAKLSFSLGNIQEALLVVYKQVLLAMIIIILANIIFGFLLSKTVIGPIKILNTSTKTIAKGDLSVRTEIHTSDELEELGHTFNYMTRELLKMRERAENANPLTKLPGNIVIREETEKRIKENQKFTIIYCDLDNFKAYNDKYGIAKGDEVIKTAADIAKEAIKNNGNPDDFIGHEGGDDFILLTTPEKAKPIADSIIAEFAKKARLLYDPEDLNKGYIVSEARDGSLKQFPIISISLAGVSNEGRPITSYAEVTNIAAEVKKKAKNTGGSIFILDKRQAG